MDRIELINFLKACSDKKINPSDIPKERPYMTFKRMEDGKYINEKNGDIYTLEKINSLFTEMEENYSPKHKHINRIHMMEPATGEISIITVLPLTKEEIKDIIIHNLNTMDADHENSANNKNLQK